MLLFGIIFAGRFLQLLGARRASFIGATTVGGALRKEASLLPFDLDWSCYYMHVALRLSLKCYASL